MMRQFNVSAETFNASQPHKHTRVSNWLLGLYTHTQTHKLSPVLHQNVSEHVSQDRDVLYRYRHAAKINIQ